MMVIVVSYRAVRSKSTEVSTILLIYKWGSTSSKIPDLQTMRVRYTTIESKL